MVRRKLTIFIITWSLVGYPLLAIINHIFQLPNSTISLTFRGLCFAIAITLIMTARRARFDMTLFMFTVFGLAYAVQLILTLHIRLEPSALDPIEYWVWMFGASILPAIATYFCFSNNNQEHVFSAVSGTAIVATCLLLMFGSTNAYLSNGTQVDTGRFGIPSLNPIATGHIAATTILLGISTVLSASRMKLRQALFAGGSIFSGGTLLLLANSRGPLVALGASLFVLALTRFNRRGTLIFLGFAFCGTLFFLSSQSGSILTDGLFRRLDLALSGEDNSTSMRLLAFSGAWQQFLGSPLIGDGIEVHLTGFYPHNVILEAFMTTGLIGGIPFVLLLLGALASAFTLLRRQKKLIWLALILVQYVVAAQLSGGLYQVTAMWVSIAAILAVRLEIKLNTKYQPGSLQTLQTPR